jgi:hypothetical protein
VAERERLTNKERRAKAREERKRKEAEAARKRRVSAIRNGAITAVVVAVVAAVVIQAFTGDGDSLDDAILISSTEVEQAYEAAGCETLVDREPLPDSSHFDANDAPPADLIYPEIRPTHSGPHTAQVHPIIRDGAATQIDEKTSTHNLEHGAIIAWYDPDQVDETTADEMGDWAGTLNASGFQQRPQTGTAVFVSPYEDPGISSGKAVALRAWGVAVDCDEWNETVALGFVAEHYGTHGIGPERVMAPYPEGTIEFSDREIEDTPQDEAPVDEEPTPDEADLDEDADEVDAENGEGDEGDDES